MDRDMMKDFLTGASPIYIRPGDELTFKDLNWLGNRAIDFRRVEILFSLALEEGGHLKVQRPCLKCLKVEWREWTPGLTLNFLKAYRASWLGYRDPDVTQSGMLPDFFCKTCGYELFPLKENTNIFIEAFLCPDPGGVDPYWENMKELYQVSDKDAIAERIKELRREEGYDAFLNTRYWKLLSKHVREVAGLSCQLCGRCDEALHCHHRTYKHFGYEIEFWKEDLICLCKDCHEKFHDKLTHEEIVPKDHNAWRGSAVLEKIIELLGTDGGMSAREVASALGCRPRDIGWAFAQLKREGKAFKENGTWRLVKPVPLPVRITDFLMKAGPQHPRDLAKKLSISSGTVRKELMMLKDIGFIRRLPDGRFMALRKVEEEDVVPF